MSLALDLGLFFRNSKTKLGLSLTQRGLLFTLAIRIGNHSSTWIKQSTLAKEAGIDERNVRENMVKIKTTNIILVEYQKSDKRKLQYRFNPLLTNYHLLNDEERKKIHIELGDEFEHLNVLKQKSVSTHKSSDKKYRTKSSANFEDTGRNHPLNTGRNHPLISENIPSQTPLDTASYEGGCAPKDKEESNKKNKEKGVSTLTNQNSIKKTVLPDWLPKEIWEEFKQHRVELKKPLSNLAETKAINLLKKLKDEGNDIVHVIENAIFRGWEGLFPVHDNKNSIINNNQSKPDQKNTYEPKSTVKEFDRDYWKKSADRDRKEQIKLQQEVDRKYGIGQAADFLN